MAQQLGYLTWMLLMPLFILLLIGGIQYLRTRDTIRARKAALSWWGITLAIGLWILALFSRLVESM